jgi:hypothetical protein
MAGSMNGGLRGCGAYSIPQTSARTQLSKANFALNRISGKLSFTSLLLHLFNALQGADLALHTAILQCMTTEA